MLTNSLSLSLSVSVCVQVPICPPVYMNKLTQKLGGRQDEIFRRMSRITFRSDPDRNPDPRIWTDPDHRVTVAFSSIALFGHCTHTHSV